MCKIVLELKPICVNLFANRIIRDGDVMAPRVWQSHCGIQYIKHLSVIS